jgi:ribonuclease VapC
MLVGLARAEDSLVDELLAERRSEAELEDRE